MENKIHVGLYGGKGIFGGKETPQRAEIIYCDKANECDLYKNGQCVNVTSPFSSRCKFGKIHTERGYTSRAQKYYSFNNKYKSDEKYSKLKYPSGDFVANVGEVVMLNITYCSISKLESGEYQLNNPAFRSSLAYIDIKDFSLELIKRICDFRPQAMMGGTISEYQTKSIPNFLINLKRGFPDLYNALINKYPEYKREFNYVGKKALLSTINHGEVKYKSSNYPEFNELWNWDGENLTFLSGYVHKPNVCSDFEISCMKIKPKSNSYVEIHDNAQVNDNTIFQ